MGKSFESVYIVETPLQLLNAIEAKNYFKHTDPLLIVLVTGLISETMFREMMDQSHCAKVLFIRFDKRLPRFARRDFSLQRPRNVWERFIELYQTYKQFRRRQSVDYVARHVGGADTIVVGDYREGQNDGIRHFCNRVQHNHVIVLDDGTDSLQVIKERSAYQEQRTTDSKIRKRERGSLKTRFRRKYLEWDRRSEDRLVFFSSYDLDVRKPDSLVTNRYSYLKAFATRYERTEEIIFLGQSVEEDGLLTIANYVIQLERVARYFGGRKITYIPHPRERRASVARVEKLEAFSVRRLTVPIEYELAVRGKMPKVIASFYCSALDNCRVLFGEPLEIVSFRIGKEHFEKENPLIEAIYAYLEGRTGPTFQVVPLEN